MAWTLDPAGSGTWIVYVNGAQVMTASNPYPRSVSRSSNFLGKRSWNVDTLNGGIKDFRMYSRVLSASEVATLFTSTQTIFTSSCSACPAGQYSSLGSASCSICPAGQYSSAAGSASCSACPAGSFSSSPGSLFCDSCLPGYSSSAGSASCKQCLTGTYAYSQIIANGDFELNPVTSWESQIPSNWQSRSGCLFVVASYSNAWGGGVPAPSGSFYVAVQGTSTCGRGNLQQTVAVSSALVGSTLTIQFYLSKRSDGVSSAASSVTVSINSVVLRTITLTSSFTFYSVSAPVTSTTLLVQFDDVSTATTDFGFLIDAVTLVISSASNYLSSKYSQAPSNGLQLYYRFDSVSGRSVGNFASGSVVYDASLENGATVNNNQLVLSNTSSQYMKINSFTTGTTGLTFATWWRSDNSGSWSRIMDFGNGPSSDNIVITQYSADKTIVAQLNVNSQETFSTSFSFDTKNAWNHVAWILDPSGSGISTIYINGYQASQTSPASYPRSILRSSNLIGKNNWANQSYMNGGIKDFRMYNRVLSAAEVATLFTSTQTIFSGASQCLSCSGGQYSSTNGSSVCNICSVGKYAIFAGSKKCSSCDSLYSGLACFDSGLLKNRSICNSIR